MDKRDESIVKDMKITVLGTSGGIPIPKRAQSGILIQTSEINLLLDCGMAVPLRLAEAGLNAEDIDVVCISHKHLDHIQDLPSLFKASRLRIGEAEYSIVCHTGISAYIKGFIESCGEYGEADLDFFEIDMKDVIEFGDLKIETFSTSHTENSLGFKVSENKIDMIYTSDTSIDDDIKEKVDGTNVLIHELTFLDSTEDHTGVEDLIKMIKDINVRELIITHFDPEIDEKIDDVVKEIEEETEVSVTASYDLQEIII